MKKVLKILALVVSIGLVIALLVFTDSFLGNPISRHLATKTAEKHLAEVYAGTDYEIKDLGYDFKDGAYYAHIISPSSPDTYFSLSIRKNGRLHWDSYDDSVTSGWNTSSRLTEEYRVLVDRVLQLPTFPFQAEIAASDLAYGMLEFMPREAYEDPSLAEIPDYCMPMDTLELDGVYDVSELGSQCGELVIYAASDTVTVEKAAQMLLAIRQGMDEAGIGFRTISFTLHPPRVEGEPRPDTRVQTDHFPYEEIYEEGMIDRLTAAIDALNESYDQMNAEKQAMIETAEP